MLSEVQRDLIYNLELRQRAYHRAHVARGKRL